MVRQFPPVKTVLLLPLALFACGVARSFAASPSPSTRPWDQDVIYFALTDRFFDGDPENNVPAGSDPALYDRTQTNLDRYHGGDFRGLEIAIESGYFNDLGATTLWITPPVRNVWNSSYDGNDAPKTGYHGYWTQDFLDIDPHLVSRRSLDGKREYPDSRDGRMEHYRDFVALAHRHGIKIIQDIVCNHAGPVFFYDANGNGKFDRDQKAEWIQPFRRDGAYSNAQWAETPEWDQHRTEPTGAVTVLGKTIKIAGALGNLDNYGRRGMSDDSLGKSNGEEIECDFFGLRDFWTAPDSPHFDALVNDFVEIYAFYAEEIGVDGFRIDTVKHVHHAFWDAFTERLRKRLEPERARNFILFGEVYDGDPGKVGEYSYRLDRAKNPGPCLDSLLDFPFCFALRSFLRTKDETFGSSGKFVSVTDTLLPNPRSPVTPPYYNPVPGADGLNAGQKIVNFIENHDGLNRFRVKGISERRNLVANSLLLLSPGIPCLYYGTETGLADNQAAIDADAESGRLTFVHAGDREFFERARTTRSFRKISELCALRRMFPVLWTGEVITIQREGSPKNTEDGIFVFVRRQDPPGDTLVVVVNASNETRVVKNGEYPLQQSRDVERRIPLLDARRKFRLIQLFSADDLDSASAQPRLVWQDDVPQLSIEIAPNSVSVFRVVQTD